MVAPHPFYPIPSALGRSLDRHAALFDAVEVNAMYTRLVDFNRRAITWARAHDKPLVGNTDLHLLDQMGTTYSLVDAEPSADAICDAIRARRVELRTEPLSMLRAGRLFSGMCWGGLKAGSTDPGSGHHLVDSLQLTTYSRKYSTLREEVRSCSAARRPCIG